MDPIRSGDSDKYSTSFLLTQLTRDYEADEKENYLPGSAKKKNKKKVGKKPNLKKIGTGLDMPSSDDNTNTSLSVMRPRESPRRAPLGDITKKLYQNDHELKLQEYVRRNNNGKFKSGTLKSLRELR